MATIFTVACVTGPRRPDASEYPRTPSQAISQSEASSLRDAFAGGIRANKGKSGFKLLPEGDESLRMRLALVMAAEKTLDLQYYAMRDDDAADIMLEALLQAAERGVRIRFLIDNIAMSEIERSLSMLDGNKNISVRVFNPVMTKDQGLLSRLNGLIVDLDKATKRMHNKALIADNQLAIIGGRNIGDEYFDARDDVNFVDMDLLSAGTITARISGSFDRYWNSDESFPIQALHPRLRDRDEVAAIRRDMKAAWNAELQKEDSQGKQSQALAESMKKGDVGLIWAPAELTVDDPEKVDTDADAAHSRPFTKLDYLLRNAKKEFIAMSPYFVPRVEGVAWLKDLKARGLDISILTNSLASTDVVAVHTGYKRYREDILKSGIALYEYKPIGGKRPRQRLFGSSAPPQASLHSKVYIIDRSDLVVGSYNLDPRSTELNTEIAVVMHSPELAAQAYRVYQQSIAPEQSYHLVMTADGLRWNTVEEGQPRQYSRDPGAGIVRNAETFLFSLLPIEDQL